MGFSWNYAVFYASIIGISSGINYREGSIEEEVSSFKIMKEKIENGRWDIVESSKNSITVIPQFDFPYNKIIKDKIQAEYIDGKAVLSGPMYYLQKLRNDILGKKNFWISKKMEIFSLVFILLLISVPVLGEYGLFWKIKSIRHEAFAKKIEIVDVKDDGKPGNSIENINNYGFAAEDEQNVYYVNRHLNLIKMDKELKNKEYLIEKPSGTGISRLNVKDGWIFYLSGTSLYRMRTDGTQNELIYKSGYLLDVNMYGKWLYFINMSDKFNVYKIDVNGRGLERVVKEEVSDIAIYDDRLYFSYYSDEGFYMESMLLDGTDRRVEFEGQIYNLIIHDDYFYFQGDENQIYRARKGGNAETLLNQRPGLYIIIEDTIYYTLESDEERLRYSKLYRMNLDGSGKELIEEFGSIDGLSHIGNWLYFEDRDIRSDEENNRFLDI
ncbi:MAG: DUF5050 domain-containing protein [Gudongella sp.]|jgi:hypothetical protein|nr:DUF5050 domain-containing protein [Gudongella sp.]